jgi:pyruvate ferredoxin oxidoreductase gamma subunit
VGAQSVAEPAPTVTGTPIPRPVIEVRIHGRGGQGVVTAAELLSVAAFNDGRHSQAFPSFGSERTGAPVVAFCRIDDRPIRAHDPISSPGAVIIADPTLLHQVDVFGGVRDDAYVLINTSRDLAGVGLGELVPRLRPDRLRTVRATELAREHVGRPLPNAALLGAFARLTGAVTIESVAAAIRARFSGAIGERNVAAAQAAYSAFESDERPGQDRGMLQLEPAGHG